MDLKISHRLAVPQKFEHYNKVNIVLKHDSVGSVFSFDIRFDPQDQRQAELFATSHYHEAIVSHNGETLITGFIINQKFKSSAKKHPTTLAGYSKPGTLEDCDVPPELYPLQVDGLTLKEIAERICAPYRINVVVDSSVSSLVNKSISSTTLDESSNVKEVLTKLATQRKIIVTHNEFGDLLFTKANTTGKALFNVNEGLIGYDMELVFDGQKLHSHITVMKEADSEGGNAGEVLIKNPYVPVAYTYRHKVYKQTSGDDVTLNEFARQCLQLELKAGIKLIVKVNTWTVNGKIIRPNNIITAEDPELYLYKKVSWFIEEVNFEGTEEKQVATLTCVLPCVYDDSEIENIFINAHENFPRYNFSKNNTKKSTFKA